MGLFEQNVVLDKGVPAVARRAKFCPELERTISSAKLRYVLGSTSMRTPCTPGLKITYDWVVGVDEGVGVATTEGVGVIESPSATGTHAISSSRARRRICYWAPIQTIGARTRTTSTGAPANRVKAVSAPLIQTIQRGLNR